MRNHSPIYHQYRSQLKSIQAYTITFLFPDWTAVGERHRFIPFDLESDPLQVSTDSKIGSGERIWVQFSRSDNFGFVGITVDFAESPRYSLGSCKNSEIPLNKLSKEDNRIWTIEKVDKRLRLSCNGIEIFDFDTNLSTVDTCRNSWSNDFAYVRFIGESVNSYPIDTASDYYRKYTPGKF